MKHFNRCLVMTCAILTFGSVGLTRPAHAEGSGRTAHPFGVYVDLLGDPAVSLWGINAAYNILDFMRVNVGYGSIPAITATGATVTPLTISGSSIGGGLKFFVPNWDFSPVVGANVASLSLTGSGSFFGQAASASAAAVFPYMTAGFDWQTKGGFNLGFGAIVVLGTSGTAALPFLNLGLFF